MDPMLPMQHSNNFFISFSILMTHKISPSLKLTFLPWKFMGGKRSFPFGMPSFHVPAVNFREEKPPPHLWVAYLSWHLWVAVKKSISGLLLWAISRAVSPMEFRCSASAFSQHERSGEKRRLRNAPKKQPFRNCWNDLFQQFRTWWPFKRIMGPQRKSLLRTQNTPKNRFKLQGWKDK